MKKIRWLFFFLFLFALLGFARDYFFVHLNNILYIKYYGHSTNMAVPASMRYFLGFSYETLYYIKYPFTLICTFMYFSISYFLIRKIAATPFFNKILVYSYILITMLAVFSQLYGYLTHNRLTDDEYTLSRWLMGILQSPIICLILVASERLYVRTVSDEHGNKGHV